MTDDTNLKDMLGRNKLATASDALALLMEHLNSITPRTENVVLDQAFGRIIGHSITSNEDLPAWSRSTMDGYAVRSADTFGASENMPCYLNITGEIEMGKAPEGEVKKGCCNSIPTGGLLPKGADSVLMLEHTVPVDDSMIEVTKGIGAGTNIIQKGEDILKDHPALPAGHLLRPQDIGLLAGIGISSVPVTERLRVGILSTGDEIIPHTAVPKPGQIRNINSLTLAGLVRNAGGYWLDYGIVSDDKNNFIETMRKAVEENDIVLFSGGSSVGVRDLGEQVIEELGPPGILVHGVTIKPGKPLLIGMSSSTPIFGLPGHPVSAMVCFDLFVKPTIQKLSGLDASKVSPIPSVMVRLTRNINSAPGRRDIVRVKIRKDDEIWSAEPVLGKSGSISSLAHADGFFIIEEDKQGVTEDSVVKVYIYQ